MMTIVLRDVTVKGMFDVSYTVLLIIEWISNSHGICCDITLCVYGSMRYQILMDNLG